jgi:D-galactarolactone isomerase
MAESVLPAGTVDTHMHFYDARFPAAPAAVLRPPDATPADYRQFQSELGMERVVVVQPTTYGLDNRCQLDAMAAFGDKARGVMVVDDSVTNTELKRLTALGVRGARFHMLAGGAVPWSILSTVAAKVHDFGWHVQLQLNGRELEGRLDELLRLPGRIVVDHVGRFMPPVARDHGAFSALLALIETGRCWVKLSAPYESSVAGPPDYPDVAVLARALIVAAPERMLWATNWPHPGQENPPDPTILARLIGEWAGDTALHQILVANPHELYGFDDPGNKGVATSE